MILALHLMLCCGFVYGLQYFPTCVDVIGFVIPFQQPARRPAKQKDIILAKTEDVVGQT